MGHSAASRPSKSRKRSQPDNGHGPAGSKRSKYSIDMPKGFSVSSPPLKANGLKEASTARRSAKGGVSKPLPSTKGSERNSAGPRRRTIVNQPPRQRLDIHVFGSNSQAELGLGKDVDSRPVRRPRANQLLAAQASGIVDIALGAQHCVALSHDNKVLTWGVNDLWALGRDTSWDGGLVDAGEEDDSSDSDEGAELNPRECTPLEVDAAFFGAATITSVAASDNASFAVTDEGRVHAWGTFRNLDGRTSFSRQVDVQRHPTLVPLLRNVKKIATGDNHVLALTATGDVYAWGLNGANELGRKTTERNRDDGLTPTKVRLPKGIVEIAAGANHSFAIDRNGTVFSWGSNNNGETGHEADFSEDNCTVVIPAPVVALQRRGRVSCIAGGRNHSIAAAEDGSCLVWGRLDGSQTGIPIKDLPEDQVVRNEYGRPRILKAAVALPDLKVKMVDAAIECSIVVTSDNKAYSWGFSSSYRTGLGTEDDVELPKQVLGSVKDSAVVWAGLGAQFGMLACAANPQLTSSQTNGVTH